MTSLRRRFLQACAALAASASGWWLMAAAPKRRKAIIRSVFAANAKPPKLSNQHLQLIRQLRVTWVPIESGAPGIDSSQPLRGKEPTLHAAMQILKTDDEALATRLLAELGLLISEFVSTAQLKPGRYALPADMPKLSAQHTASQSGEFDFQTEHQLLLKAAQWREVSSHNIDDVLDSETGDEQIWPMPYIDGKRPYGDRSYYQIDMAEILGQPYAMNAKGRPILEASKDAKLAQLHRQSLAALQVFLMHADIA